MSTLKATLQTDVTKHLKAGNAVELLTVRNVLGEIERKELAGRERVELTDLEVISILKKQAASRRDNAAIFTDKLNQPDRAAQEIAEAEVIETYLPVGLTEAEATAIVEAAITEVGATDLSGLGSVMKLVKGEINGRYDGGAVAALVKAKLS